MLTKDNDNSLPFKEKDRTCPELVEGVGMGFANIRRLVPILLFAACMTATAAFAGSPEPEAVRKAYTKAEKTCKQIERDHEKMKGEHKLMFKAWQEKSSPLLTEDEEVITECNTTRSALKDVIEQIDKTVSDDSVKEALSDDFEKIQHIMEDVTARHKTLREKHERLFHEMMGH